MRIKIHALYSTNITQNFIELNIRLPDADIYRIKKVCKVHFVNNKQTAKIRRRLDTEKM